MHQLELTIPREGTETYRLQIFRIRKNIRTNFYITLNSQDLPGQSLGSLSFRQALCLLRLEGLLLNSKKFIIFETKPDLHDA